MLWQLNLQMVQQHAGQNIVNQRNKWGAAITRILHTMIAAKKSPDCNDFSNLTSDHRILAMFGGNDGAGTKAALLEALQLYVDVDEEKCKQNAVEFRIELAEIAKGRKR